MTVAASFCTWFCVVALAASTRPSKRFSVFIFAGRLCPELITKVNCGAESPPREEGNKKSRRVFDHPPAWDMVASPHSLLLRPPRFRERRYSLFFAFFASFDRFNPCRCQLPSGVSVGHPEVCPGFARESLYVLFSDDLRSIGVI